MNTPNGYVKRKVAQSAEEAIAQYSTDHIKTIVKAAIQKYIESFFNTTGGNRDLFEKFSKIGLQYITDKSFDASKDVTLRKTQLARMFEQVRQELPCMLIMDAGFEIMHQNWLGLDKVWVREGKWHGSALIAREVPVTIAVGTRDQSSTDILHGILSVLFGEMRWLAGGTRITGNIDIGETWVIKMGPPKLGTITQQNIADDPKEKIWMCSIELENVIFEDMVSFSRDLDKVGPPRDGVMNESDLGWTPPIICFPDQIAINEPTQVMIDLFQPEFQRIIIKNPNVAVIDPNARMVSPRRLGTTEIQVIRPRRDQDNVPDQQTGATHVVVASKTFKVVPG